MLFFEKGQGIPTMTIDRTYPTDALTHLPPGVAERLGHYVYLYVDPRDNRPFYVGKGQNERVLSHFTDDQESPKTHTIAELRAAGLSPRIDILAHGLKDEETAIRLEAAVIDLIGLEYLKNQVRGLDSLKYGRMTLNELIGYYHAPPTTIDHKVLLIRVNQLYRHNMSDLELYEITRGIWRVGERRSSADYAFAVFEGVVREVYAIALWQPAVTSHYETRDLSQRDRAGRWEFVGEVAADDIRSRYRLKSVKEYLRAGNQNPVVYVNC